VHIYDGGKSIQTCEKSKIKESTQKSKSESLWDLRFRVWGVRLRVEGLVFSIWGLLSIV
jgi:hypothetical protein